MPGYTPDNDGTFDAEFKIAIPEMQSATRSFAAPQIDNLWLFIFDSSGYISQALEVTNSEVGKITAESTDNTWEDNKATTFTVKGIAETSYSRTIHLIANLPAGTNTNGFFAESNFISSLKTSGTQDAYWQRVEMPNGITQATINALGVIPMVRNYAKVSAVSEVDKFSLTGLILTNVPNSGSVAPYHTNTLGLESGVLAKLNGNFANYRATDDNGAYTGGATDYTALEAQKYNGFEPSDVTYSDQAVPATWQTYQYLYERDHSQTEKRTYAIIQGTWNDGTTTKTTYYKVDIVKPSGDAYNLLRNIEYKIVVENVTGWGFDSAADALASPAVSNNLDFNVETRDLLNVSDGTSRLFIEYSRKVITATAGNSQITFRYRYVPDITKPTTSQNVTGNNVTISWSDFKDGVKLGGAVIADGDASASGVNWVSNNQLAADDDGYIWNEVTFKVADVGDEAKIQEFTLSAKNETTGATLSRVVELRLVKPFKFSIDVAPEVEDGAGKAVLTTLTLPKGLPKGIFPLTFNVVCGNGSLTSSLPVVTGLDINGMPTEDGKYFGYAVTIDYDNYDSEAGTVLQPLFLTNMSNAAVDFDSRTDKSEGYQDNINNNGTKVRAYNPYFEPDFSQFWIGELYGLRLSVLNFTESTATTRFQINTSNKSIEEWPTSGYFDFDILSEHTLTGVTSSDGNTVSGASFVNSGKTLRITQAAYNSTRNYTLTFSAPNITGTTIIISNAEFGTALAIVERFAVSWRIVGNDNNSNQSTMESGSQYRLRIVLPAGISDDVINTLKITAKTTRTTLSLNGQSIANNSTGTINITSSMYDSSTGYIYVPITASTVSTGSGDRSFTLTLDGGDMFVLPETMTRTYQSGGWFGTAGYQ